ncbi:MAG: hypothetical protein FJW37_12170 [Acidobacteria bacterium]|nr:hypothetical protein [Acidobacteriota bacterium]
MRRKLLLVNLALLALAALAGLRLRQQWSAAHAHERAVLGRSLHAAAPPPLSAAPPPAKIKAADYLEIAQKMLFTKDRNPVVTVEAAAPPPLKPLPPLPLFFGVMNFGDGPTVLMAAKPGSPHVDVRLGDQIGDFTLVSLEGDDLVLDFEGRPVRKSRRELARTAAEVEISRRPAAGAPAASPPPPRPSAPVKSAPGVDTGRGTRACLPGDPAPPGTVVDGYRKMAKVGMFGPECYWELINK